MHRYYIARPHGARRVGSESGKVEGVELVGSRMLEEVSNEGKYSLELYTILKVHSFIAAKATFTAFKDIDKQDCDIGV